jgi:hypothetical protein
VGANNGSRLGASFRLLIRWCRGAGSPAANSNDHLKFLNGACRVPREAGQGLLAKGFLAKALERLWSAESNRCSVAVHLRAGLMARKPHDTKRDDCQRQ